MVCLKTISDLRTYKVEILTSSPIKILLKNHTLRAVQIQISFMWEYPPSRRKDLHRLLNVFMSVQHFCATKNFLHVMSTSMLPTLLTLAFAKGLFIRFIFRKRVFIKVHFRRVEVFCKLIYSYLLRVQFGDLLSNIHRL